MKRGSRRFPSSSPLSVEIAIEQECLHARAACDAKGPSERRRDRRARPGRTLRSNSRQSNSVGTPSTRQMLRATADRHDSGTLAERARRSSRSPWRSSATLQLASPWPRRQPGRHASLQGPARCPRGPSRSGKRLRRARIFGILMELRDPASQAFHMRHRQQLLAREPVEDLNRRNAPCPRRRRQEGRNRSVRDCRKVRG